MKNNLVRDSNPTRKGNPTKLFFRRFINIGHNDVKSDKP